MKHIIFLAKTSISNSIDIFSPSQTAKIKNTDFLNENQISIVFNYRMIRSIFSLYSSVTHLPIHCAVFRFFSIIFFFSTIGEKL